MSTIRNNSITQQQNYMSRMRADVNTVDAREASHAAQTGASNQISKQNKQNKAKEPTEGLSKELQAKLAAAAEKDAESDATAQARQNVADDALVQNKSTKRKDLEQDNDDYRVGQGDFEKKDGTRVLKLDGGDDAETFEISKAQGKQLDQLDEKTPEQILAGMPENSRKAAEATLDTQMKTQGKDKVAQLKDDPKVSAQVEEMDLDPVGSFRDEAKVAPIRTPKDEPPMMVLDENAEKMAKEAAIRQMQKDGGEAMLAS